MASALWGKYVSEVLKEVKFKYDHNGIRQELIEHMEELYEDLQAEGMDAPVAEVMTVEYMGDPQEIGKALHAEHSPLLGWIWRISRWAVVIVFLICMFWYGFSAVKGAATGVLAEYKNRVVSPVVYELEIDETVDKFGGKLHFDKIVYYADEVLELRMDYLNWKEQWNIKEGRQTEAFRLDIAYEKENEIIWLQAGHQTIKHGYGVFYKTQNYIKNIPREAEKLYVNYDGWGEDYIVIDLMKGGRE